MSKKEETKTIKTNRYDFILKLGEGGMGAVYKVVDRLTGMLVALKEIKFDQAKKDENFETLAEEEIALINEFKILSSLRHPNIVSVLDYGLDKNLPFFTMELLAAPKTLTEFTKGKDKNLKIHLLVQLLQALAYLHHRRVIHRDLKPANILVDGLGILKVLDFGIALAQEYLIPAQDSISGTLAYLAPEVLQGEAVSIASDLYAFGLIAYEVLVEKYPYNYDNVASLVKAIISERIDVSPLDDEIAVIIGRLLEKDPADRYQDIDKLLEDFVNASHYEMPVETLAIRESFLQAASFVGREEPFQQLRGLLTQSISGKGQVCLVAGESGVGKSRLLSELRVLALVERVIVLRGQGASSANTPYHLWRHIFRYMTIISELSDDEASVLGTIISDIDMLMGREIDTAPQLTPNAVRERFENTVLNIFKRQTVPILLILEDLQWADEESLSLLKRLAETTSDLPLFILGSYRNEETPNLPQEIPQATIIKLERFDSEKMARLASALLGRFGEEPKIVEFLYRETGGNVFFAIEVLRVLANQVGNLRDISQMRLPTEITAGGIIAVLRKRLERIPEEYYPLVQIAALYGRELDSNLLQHLMPEIPYEKFLEVLSELAILEVEDNVWRFSHDKLREEVLRKMQEDGLSVSDKHQEIALGIESLYANNSDYIPVLAHHWSEAKVADKAIHFNEKAAEMVYRYAPSRGIKHIETVLAFDKDGAKTSKERHITRHAIMGSCYYFTGENEKALDSLEVMVGHLGASPMPDNMLSGMFALISQAAIHTTHRIFPNQFLAKKDSDWLPELTLNSMYDMPMIYMAQGKMPHALYSILMNVNFIERLKPSTKSNPVIGYAWLHFVLGLIPLRGLSNYYRKKVKDILADKRQQEEMPVLVKIAAEATLMVNDFYNARWQEVITYIQENNETVRKMGDHHALELGMYYLGLTYQLMGQISEAEEQFKQGYEQSSSRNDLEMQFSMFVFLTALLVKTDKLGEAEFAELRTSLETGSEVYKNVFKTNPLNKALYHAVRADYFLSNEELSSVIKEIKAASEIIEKRDFDPNPTFLFLYDSVLGNAFNLLNTSGYKQSLSANDEAMLMQAAKTALKFIKQANRIMVFAQAVYSLGQARMALLESKQSEAIEHLNNAIKSAESTELAYYKAIAQLLLAETDKSQAGLLEAATASLEAMGIRDSKRVAQ